MANDVRPRVLIVEDEPDMNRLLAEVLSAYGFEPIAALTGERALEILADDRPDAILLDLMLPGINGLDVCKQLKSRRQTRGLPILILTALESAASRRNGYEAGADDYVTKPFAPDALVARLRTCLDQVRHARDDCARLMLTFDLAGAQADLKALNTLATCLSCRTDLPDGQIEALHSGLVELSEAAGRWAADHDGMPPARVSIDLEPSRLRVALEADSQGGKAWLAEHTGADAAAASAMTAAGAVDSIAPAGEGRVVLEKALAPRPAD